MLLLKEPDWPDVRATSSRNEHVVRSHIYASTGMIAHYWLTQLTSGYRAAFPTISGRSRRRPSASALVAGLEPFPYPVRVAGDAGRRRPQFLEHLLLADPVPEPVHL